MNETVRLKTTIKNLSHEGRGVSQVEQKTVFIDNALPGEEVIFEYKKKHRRYDEALAVEIVKASPVRVEALCPHFNQCGGCSLQHLEVEAQLQAKQDFLLEQLQHFGKITPENVFPPITGPVWGYRQKARLGVRYVKKKEKLLVGFHEKNSSKVAEITSCEILHPKVACLIEPLKSLITGLSVFQAIPQIEVAIGIEGVALVFRIMQPLSGEDREQCIHFAKTQNILLYMQPKGPESLERIYPENTVSTQIADKENKAPFPLLHYTLPEYNLKFAFSPLDFIQVNQTVNQQMVKRVIELLQPTNEDTILDLFCGLGNFTLPLAKFAKRVIGVEGHDKMVFRARDNAILNQLNNVEFYQANLEEADLDTVLPVPLSEFDKILLDPARSGALKMMQMLISAKPHLKKLKQIVYVSCNPASFARDLGLLVNEGGYRLQGVQVLNMFPHTSHVESLALLIK